MGDSNINNILLIVAGFILLVIYFKYNEYKNKKELVRRLKEQWQKVPNREYSHDKMEGIKRYFTIKKDNAFHIDDITWNDLGMDGIFQLINQTYSSIGEQYLYYLLRTPRLKKDTLDERKKKIDFFEQNEKERLQMQTIYAEIGRTGNYSISDYIYNLADLEKRSNILEYAMFLLGVISIVAALTIPTYGMIVLLVVMVLNIAQYYKIKGEVEPYFVSVSYINRILNGADSLVKVLPNDFKEEIERTKHIKSQFKAFRRDARWVKSGKRANGALEDVLLDYVKMFFHIDLIKFNYILSEVKKKIDLIDELIEIMGSMEAYIAIASFRGALDYYSIPLLEEGTLAHIDIEEVYHPRIQNPVVNSIKEDTSVLITGSNASGKSTFLKTLAINAILAQTIYMTMAKKYHANFFRIYSSMALTDNLMGNESYYIVEIKSLKRILDAAKESIPILCFVDEVLRGTNTVERIAASAQILKSLNQQHVMCFAATHDIELTHILESMFHNYHFEEEVIENDILFSYELKANRATSRNAIKLLSIIGYDDTIINEAEASAAYFMNENRWEKLK